MKQFKRIFEIYLKEQEDHVGCKVSNEFELDASIIAGSMIAILEAVLSQLDDSEQIEFEKEVVELFHVMLPGRFDFLSKETLDEDE